MRVIKQAIRTNARYIGMIASKRWHKPPRRNPMRVEDLQGRSELFDVAAFISAGDWARGSRHHVALSTTERPAG
jgi:hypothetical protein